MEDYVFDAIMMNESYICNDCLENQGGAHIDINYQDTGNCEMCNNVTEISKPIAATMLMKKGYDLYKNHKIRQLFFHTRPVGLIKPKKL